MKLKECGVLIASILLAQAAGFLGSIFTASKIPNWYATLAKPPLTPPSWVFAPVWTILFTLMGIAAFLVWRQKSVSHQFRKYALRLYGLQLVLNITWSFIFFGLQNPGGAFLEIIALWLMIVFTIKAFERIYRPAGWLMLPYILWVTFASYLTFSIWLLN